MDQSTSDAINEVTQKATAKNPDQCYKDVLAMAIAFREAAGLSASQAADKLVQLLTPRKQEVLKLIIEGKSNREIATKLTIELTTVKWYVTQNYHKLNVRSRVQAIVRAKELDLIHAEFTLDLRYAYFEITVGCYFTPYINNYSRVLFERVCPRFLEDWGTRGQFPPNPPWFVRIPKILGAPI